MDYDPTDTSYKNTWGTAHSEKPNKKVSSSKKKSTSRDGGNWKFEGRDSIKEMDLEDSFCGTIEERDEMEEPEMQDISFSKDLGSEEKITGSLLLQDQELHDSTTNTLPENLFSPKKESN